MVIKSSTVENRKNPVLHYDIEVEGRVQGVGFRYSAMNMARSLGIHGFVKNRWSGTVYLEIEGEEANLNSMIEWCRIGPGTGHVTNIRVQEGSLRNFTGFEIRH
jgi:acylphosphatase